MRKQEFATCIIIAANKESIMSKVKVQSFINGCKGITVYLSCPMVLHELVSKMEQSSFDAKGKELFPSMAIELPNTLKSLRVVNELEQKLSLGKHVLNVEFDEDAEPSFYTTKATEKSPEGNRQMKIPGIVVDLTTVTPFVGKVIMPEVTNTSPATAEELELLAANAKRAEAQAAKRIAASQS